MIGTNNVTIVILRKSPTLITIPFTKYVLNNASQDVLFLEFLSLTLY